MLEYLILNNRIEAALKYKEVSSKSYQQQLLNSFDKGKREQFFRIYSLFKQESKLQFYLRVYFLIYNIHPHIKSKNSIPFEEVESFKDYLNNKGAQLAKTTEFLQFYALPFIKKHLEHQAFKPIFKKQWIHNLRQKLKKYMSFQEQRMNECVRMKLFGQSSSLPTFKIPQKESTEKSQKLKQMQMMNQQLWNQIQSFNEKYAKLQENHRMMNEAFNSQIMESQSKWFQITKQLVNCSKNLIQMIIVSRSDIVNHRKFIKIQKRTQKYQRFVNKKLDDLISQSQDLSVFDKPSINQLSYTVTPTQKNITTFLPIQEYLPTDFNLLKKDFIHMKNSDKKKVLQGLSWRILRSRDCYVRRQNMIGIFISDLLNIKNGGVTQLLAYHQLMKPTLQLISCISQQRYGRKILMDGNVYKDLISLLNESDDQICLDYICMTLDKLSYHDDYSLNLIQFGLPQYLINLLKQVWITSNENILENIVACILNLSARQQGADAFQNNKNTIKNLAPLLSSQYPPLTRVIVMGLLYQLVCKRKKIFIMAQQYNLIQFVNKIIEEDPSNVKQLNMLAEKLVYYSPLKQKYDFPQQQKDFDDDDQSINFDQNQPEDMEDLIKAHQFLVSQYLLMGRDAVNQMDKVKKAIKDFESGIVQKKQMQLQSQVQKSSSQKGFEKQQNQQNQVKKSRQTQHQQKQKSVEKNLIINQKKSQQQFKSPPNQSFKSPQIRKSQKTQQISSNKVILYTEKISVNNFFQNKKFQAQEKQKNKKDNIFRVRDKQSRKTSQQRPINRDRKSVSVQRKAQTSHGHHQKQFQSQVPMRHVTQFRASQQKNIRSPQQSRPSRQQLLRQLNQQIKAQKKVVSQKDNIKPHNLSYRQNQNRQFRMFKQKENNKNRSSVQQQYGQVFQSRPKLRRTPPKD